MAGLGLLVLPGATGSPIVTFLHMLTLTSLWPPCSGQLFGFAVECLLPNGLTQQNYMC